MPANAYIEHIRQDKIQQFINSRHFSATTDFSKLKETDAVIICVPTPLDERANRISATSSRPPSPSSPICKRATWWYSIHHLSRHHRELVLPHSGKKRPALPDCLRLESDNIPTDFFLAFSPEREIPGNKQYGLAQIPKSSVVSIRPAAAPLSPSTLKSSPKLFRLAPLAPRKWPSCSKTFSAASTSLWLTN